MDLLQTVRKEGSRGGVNFSWSDVKTSQHRENYLGHSLMAPVGRWQKNKDLGWYAKADDAELTPEERSEKERLAKREELRKVKEAEEDAMARALGLPVPERGERGEEGVVLGGVDVQRAVREAMADDREGEVERGVGFGGFGGFSGRDGGDGKELLKGSRSRDERLREWDGDRDDQRSSKRRRRSRSRSRDRDHERRHRHRHRHHERSRSRSPQRRRRSRSKDRRRDDERDRRHRHADYVEPSRNDERSYRRRRSRSRERSRSRSPRERRRDRGEK